MLKRSGESGSQNDQEVRSLYRENNIIESHYTRGTCMGDSWPLLCYCSVSLQVSSVSLGYFCTQNFTNLLVMLLILSQRQGNFIYARMVCSPEQHDQPGYLSNSDILYVYILPLFISLKTHFKTRIGWYNKSDKNLQLSYSNTRVIAAQKVLLKSVY